MRSQLQVISINAGALGFSALEIKEILQLSVLALTIIYTTVKTIREMKNDK